MVLSCLADWLRCAYRMKYLLCCYNLNKRTTEHSSAQCSTSIMLLCRRAEWKRVEAQSQATQANIRQFESFHCVATMHQI